MKPRLGSVGLVSWVSVVAAIAVTVGCFPPALDQVDSKMDGLSDVDELADTADVGSEVSTDGAVTDATVEVDAEAPGDGSDALEELVDGRDEVTEVAVPTDVAEDTTSPDGDGHGEVVSLNACGGVGALTPGEPGAACGSCGDGELACDLDDPDKDTTRCEGASALNACQGCGELSPPLGSGCDECGQVVCDGGGGTRCASPAGGCETPLGCADLDCGQRRRACVEGDGTSDASCGGCLATWVEVGDQCVGDAPPPDAVTASTGRDDAILVQWAASVHATGYRLFRCAGTCGEAGPWTALLPVAIAATSYPDESAAPPSLPAAPTVTASNDRPGDVTVSWSTVSAPAAPRYSYRVVAVGPSGESAPSAVAVGQLAERPVTGYEVQRDGGSWEAAVGTGLVDAEAPAPTLIAGEATASQGAFADHVQLALTSWESLPGAARAYRVRAVTAFGVGAASAEAVGRRQAGALQFGWERSADSAPADFTPLAGATGTTFQDTGLPPDGVVRYYRARLSATGAATVTSAAVAGWRQPRPGVPQIASVTTELADRVEIRWAPVDGASAYHVYRGETRLTSASGATCAATPCLFSDGGAPAPGAWVAPSGVGASTDLATGVNVVWTAPNRPLGASQSYRVSAINQSGESERSTPVSGWRAAPALTGFEIQATVGANTTSHSVGPEVTSYHHAEAPMATFASATLGATKGDHRAHVRLTLSGGSLTAAASVSYRVRGTLEGGGATGWSTAANGQRAAGTVTRTWQHATSSSATTWSTLPTATCAAGATSCDDTTASPLGERRWYRVQSSGAGAQAATSSVIDGWRLAFAGIAASENGACAWTPLIPDGGRLWCWGQNQIGQAGLGTTSSSVPVPTRVPDLQGVAEVSAASAGAHYCARKTDNSVWCWGWNVDGQVGDGTSGTANQVRATPKEVSGINATALAMGGRHSCALVLGQNVQCWGRNDLGQLGDNSTELRALPVVVKTSPSTNLGQVTSLGNGSSHSCATRSNGEVWCWGANASYQLGQTTPTSSSVAIRATSLTGAARVAAGESFGCAIASQAASCWGNNTYGQLGRGELGGNHATHQLVSGPIASSLDAGRHHVCTLGAGPQSGTVACWGRNQSGQLGVGDMTARELPVTVQTPDGSGELDEVIAVSVGAFHTCVVRGGHPMCWGNNIAFGLGDGTDSNRLRPVAVVLP